MEAWGGSGKGWQQRGRCLPAGLGIPTPSDSAERGEELLGQLSSSEKTARDLKFSPLHTATTGEQKAAAQRKAQLCFLRPFNNLQSCQGKTRPTPGSKPKCSPLSPSHTPMGCILPSGKGSESTL